MKVAILNQTKQGAEISGVAAFCNPCVISL